MVAQGPDVPDRLKKYISVEQTIRNEFPMHLPEVHKETSKVIEQSTDMPSLKNPQNESSRRRDTSTGQSMKVKVVKESKEERAKEMFFKPFENA